MYPSFSSRSRIISANDSAAILETAVALCRLEGLKLLQGSPAVDFPLAVLQNVSVSSHYGGQIRTTQPSELSSPYSTGHAVHFTLSFPALYDPPINTQNFVSLGTNGPALEATPRL